jgi:hypothetical protein
VGRIPTNREAGRRTVGIRPVLGAKPTNSKPAPHIVGLRHLHEYHRPAAGDRELLNHPGKRHRRRLPSARDGKLKTMSLKVPSLPDEPAEPIVPDPPPPEIPEPDPVPEPDPQAEEG